MLQSQGLLHDTYYYGVDAKKFIPTFMYPTEILDGAIVSGNWCRSLRQGDHISSSQQPCDRGSL